LITKNKKSAITSPLFFLMIILTTDLVCQADHRDLIREIRTSHERSPLLALQRTQGHQASLKAEIAMRKILHESLQKDLDITRSVQGKDINIGATIRKWNATPLPYFNPSQAKLCHAIDTTTQLLNYLNHGSLQYEWEVFHNLKEEGSVTLPIVNKYSQIVAGMELSIPLDATVVSPQSLKNFLEQQRKIAVIKLQSKTKQTAIVDAKKAVSDSQYCFDKANFDLAALQSDERCFALQGIAKNFKGHVGNWQKIIQQRKIAEERQLADQEQEQHLMAVQEQQTRTFLQEEKKQQARAAKKARKKLPKVQDASDGSQSSELDELITQFTATDKPTEVSIDRKIVVCGKKKIDKVVCGNQRLVHEVLDAYKNILRDVSDGLGKKEDRLQKITGTVHNIFELQEQLSVRNKHICDYLSVEQYATIKSLYDRLGEKIFLHQADNISAFLRIRQMSLKNLEEEIAASNLLLQQAQKEHNIVFVERYRTDLAEQNKRKERLKLSCDHYQKMEQQKFAHDYFHILHGIGSVLNPMYKSTNFHRLPMALTESQLQEMLDPIKKDFKALKIASAIAPDKVELYNRSITAKLQEIFTEMQLTETDKTLLPELYMTTTKTLVHSYIHNLLNRQSVVVDIYEKLRCNNDVLKEYPLATLKTMATIQARLIEEYAAQLHKKT
jgi:hypothetical protein